MTTAVKRKEHIRWSINQNPTEITIQRTSKIRSGGGLSEQKTTVGPFTVRIFTSGSGQAVDTGTIGTKETSAAYSLLADDTADLQAGPNVTDCFQCILGSFQITAVYPQIVQGVVCGYQADLEKVI